MTCYYGGKQRIGKKLATAIWVMTSLIEAEQGVIYKGYCEPFCGMLGVYQHIPELFEDHEPAFEYKAGDINESVVMMWQDAQKGWIPPSVVTEEEFFDLKNSENSALKGYVGHQYSYGGRYFTSYSPNYGKPINMNTTAKKIPKIAQKLENVEFSQGIYEQYSDLEKYVIYCDPPYEGTSSPYHGKNDKKIQFNHEAFWEWCRKMSINNLVYISSYKAPKDFKCILEHDHKISGHMVHNKKRDRTEKLFMNM